MTFRPLVTVAIPLYESAPLVSNIVANIDRLTYPNLEILISDRHMADDAMDQLESRYGEDSRVRFLRQRDRADWVTHYNALLGEARGQYFCWMPHDDHYETDYIERLVTALDARPDAILAFGVMHARSGGGEVPVGPFVLPPLPADGTWSLWAALRLLLSWELFRVVRGMMRRDAVVGGRLFVPALHETVHADVCWAFSMAVTAPFVFVPAASCTKSYRRDSASSAWRYGVREAVSEWRVMNRSLWQSSHPRRHVLPAALLIAALALLRVCWRGARTIAGRPVARIPVRARATASRGLRWFLAPRRER